MDTSEFWTSQDGKLLSVEPLDERRLRLTIGFRPRHPGEQAFLAEHAGSLAFTERSTLARIGIEMIAQGAPGFDGQHAVLEAEAFLFDESFPHAGYWRELMRVGTPVGRLYHAPESVRLSTAEILEAMRENRLKLPDTISIDRLGSVFLTPHHVRYTLSERLQRSQFERLVAGVASRRYLDKVQVRHESSLLTIEPQSGILTSCSMYLREHYIVLNRGGDNFGVHTCAVLLDPVATSGTNIMLEIYNRGDQPVVNPMVSVELFRAPPLGDRAFKALRKRRLRLLDATRTVYGKLDTSSLPTATAARPRTRLSVMGESAVMENPCLFLEAGEAGKAQALTASLEADGFRTLVDALDAAPAKADTLVLEFLPNLMEHVELLTRLPGLTLRRIIFRQPSRDHGFFLSNNAHSRLEVYHALGIDVHWYNAPMDDLYVHIYKKAHGFFVRDELRQQFREATIFAFYGSAENLERVDTDRISALIEALTTFIGGPVGVLTGGGGGVMRLATDQARAKGALTGACFLELEAQPPEMGVDFFNTFQETARHNRQKWFEVADFCIFNVGGVGTLEEIGIEMCNLKLGIRSRIPFVFYNAQYWASLKTLIEAMIAARRAPSWMNDYILFSNDPAEVVDFYRRRLQVM
ncbi:MAG: LOG family protein [Opitutales bacterium]